MNHNRVLWESPILVQQWAGRDMKGLDQITEGWSQFNGSKELWEGRRPARVQFGLTLWTGFDVRAAVLTEGQPDFGVSSQRLALLVKMLPRATAKQLLIS